MYTNNVITSKYKFNFRKKFGKEIKMILFDIWNFILVNEDYRDVAINCKYTKFQ